jgi:DNA polymerase I-like protein with 3'-5' exonuclease and polymerase domains
VPEEGFVFARFDITAADIMELAMATLDASLIADLATGDAYRAVASSLFGIDYDRVSSAQREAAKGIALGLIYGLGVGKLTLKLVAAGIPVDQLEARRLRASLLARWPAVDQWLKDIDRQKPATCPSNFGRPLAFTPDDSHGSRRNVPIQSSVADGMKSAIWLLHDRLDALGAHLVLYAHDELLIEVRPECAQKMLQIGEDLLWQGFNAQQFGVPEVERVPIRVKADIRTTWSDDDVIHNHNSPAKW